jgi:hypothetical protein
MNSKVSVERGKYKIHYEREERRDLVKKKKFF